MSQQQHHQAQSTALSQPAPQPLEEVATTMFSPINPLSPAAVSNPYLMAPSPQQVFPKVNYRAASPLSFGRRVRKSLWQTLLAYLPARFLAKKLGVSAPTFWQLALGLFGFHSIKHWFTPATLATVPATAHRLNIAG